MRRLSTFAVFPVVICLTFARLLAQRPAADVPRVDFARDVRPIFEQHCVECHGPDKQMNGFRLDRRHDAMRGGTAVMIGRGSAASSRLYLRLVGTTYGRRMPLDETPLSVEQIATIKAWIDQGAEWPDAVAGDVTPAPLDQEAIAGFEAIRAGNVPAFLAAVGKHPRVSTLRGPGGATPLMAAALYGDASLVKTLLDAGASPNVGNDAGATPLMWALADLQKTRLLIEAGADVNARSNDGRQPILIAAAIRGNHDVLRLLLDRGANPSVTSATGAAPIAAISEAAKQGDEAAIRLLLERGADPARGGAPAVAFSIRAGCGGCLDALLPRLPAALLSPAMTLASPPLGGAAQTLRFLDRGADVNARNPAGFPLLVLAAGSEAMTPDILQALLARGADLHAQGPNGETALEVALRHGRTPVAEALVKAGLQPPPLGTTVPARSGAASARAAIERTLPLLQRADQGFTNKAGCVSCHNNTQTAETMAAARARGIAVNAAIDAAQARKIVEYADEWRERLLQGQSIAGDSNTLTAILGAWAAQRQKPSLTTDAMARFIRLQQTPAGHWRPFSNRPPIETGEIKITVQAIRALQAFAPPHERAQADAAIGRAAAWLLSAEASNTQERAFHLLGLHLTNAARPAIDAAARRLIETQRADGGWAQLSTLDSDAYATGEALVALLESGARRPADPAVRKGVQFLLKTQLADGSWFVGRRAIPLQPYFDAEFPHGRDQFVSAAATNWAAQALLLSLSVGS